VISTLRSKTGFAYSPKVQSKIPILAHKPSAIQLRRQRNRETEKPEKERAMFGFLKKDPLKQLNKEYGQILEQAMQAQRNGDIEGYSRLSEKADALYKEIQQFESQR
jgi:hypothetical protein